MYCMNCGKQLPDGAKFCLSCGKATEAVASTEPTRGSAPVPEKELKQIETLTQELRDNAEHGNYKSAANQLRQILEIMVRFLLKCSGLQSNVDLKTGIEQLYHNNIISPTSYSNYEFMRRVGNNGSHADGIVTEAMLHEALQKLGVEVSAFRCYSVRDYSNIDRRASADACKGSTATPLLDVIVRVIGGIIAIFGGFFAITGLTRFTGGFFGGTGIIFAIIGGAFAIFGLALAISGTKLPQKLSEEITNAVNNYRR